MKTNFQKQKPIILNYRNYIFFDNEFFRNELMCEMSKSGFCINCKSFETLFITILNKHAPPKKKYIRANNSPFMNKPLSKAIMFRSKLRNKYLKLKTIKSRNAYKKQCNYCVSLLRKTKKEFYENLNPRLIADIKTFWKQVKPFFSDKTPMNRNIILLDGDKIISSPEKCAEIMNNFFSDAVLELDIDRSLYVDSLMNIINPVEKAIEMFKNHPSIISIYELGYEQNNFSFHPIFELNIHTAINNIGSSKAYQKNNIPPKVLKENSDVCAIVIRSDINKCISKGEFPNNLKNADITPTFKKGDHLLKNKLQSCKYFACTLQNLRENFILPNI